MDFSLCYDQFSIILNERVSYQRKTNQNSLSQLSKGLVSIIVNNNCSPFLLELLDENIDSILKDCEIYHGMTENKAVDALVELSSLACLFVYRNQPVYDRICRGIKAIQSSYPASDL